MVDEFENVLRTDLIIWAIKEKCFNLIDYNNINI